jgi:hypothetical protein
MTDEEPVMDLNAIWTMMQSEFERLHDARQAFDAAFDPAAGQSRLERARAAVEFAQDLCRFMTKARERGVFDALLDSPNDQSEARDQLLAQLDECLRVEAILLERAGVKADNVRSLMDDIRAVARPPYPIVAADLWSRHVDEAIGVACNFPRSAVLLEAGNLVDYVQALRTKYRWVVGAMVGVADILTAMQDPTLIGAAKVSKYLAVLMSIGHEGSADGPGMSA